jgi:CrcB protein
LQQAPCLADFGNERIHKYNPYMLYLWVALGSAIGGVLRYALSRAFEPLSPTFPWGTVVVNILGCFVIGYFGTLTLHNGKYPLSEAARIFVMVGICGGFTTFSSFGLQTFDLLRSGAWPRALANVLVSVLVCLLAIAAGHRLAQGPTLQAAIAQTTDEEFTG